MDSARLERSATSHRGMLTKFINLATIMIRTLQTNPSQWAAQELERLKQQIDWKVEDMEAGYDILLADLDPAGDDYKRLYDLVMTTIQKHADISKKLVETLGAAPARHNQGAAPATAGVDQVKLKER